MKSRIVGAVEIGTSKVLVLVGDFVRGQTLNIIGMGQSTSVGVKKGEIVDFKAASGATHAALMAAEKSAGVPIENICVAQTGAHTHALYQRASVRIRSSDNIVDSADMQRVQEEVKNKELPTSRTYIQHAFNCYYVDGRPVLNPLGMEGQCLDAEYWSFDGDTQKVKHTINILNGFGLRVEDMVMSSLASASVAATSVEKKHGVLVIDIGCGTTDYAVFKNNKIVAVGCIPVGGDHWTNDLSLGLRVSGKHAEKVKKEMGNCIVPEAEREKKVWIIGDKTIGDRYVRQDAIFQIIRARTEELLSLIKKSIEATLPLSELAGGAVFTGGGSRLKGLPEVGSDLFGIDVRLAENPTIAGERLRDPEFSTALGLLHFSLKEKHKDYITASARTETLFKKMSKLFVI
ncbi:MAG: cell division protein FtsA [Verrucomicrobia bacterium GWF2_51_19]|nr:MAG: cell division protein FtsA [Verrucomicrobia bacterium GWF2_51_19]